MVLGAWSPTSDSDMVHKEEDTQNVKDRIQIRAYKINKERVIYFFPLIPVKVKKILRKSRA